MSTFRPVNGADVLTPSEQPGTQLPGFGGVFAAEWRSREQRQVIHSSASVGAAPFSS